MWTCDQKTRAYLISSIIKSVYLIKRLCFHVLIHLIFFIYFYFYDCFLFNSLLKEVPILEAKGKAEHVEERKKSSHAVTNFGNIGGGGGGNAGGNQAGGVLPPGLTTSRGDLTNLIGVGLIGALNTNGYSNTSALASTLFASGASEESNFSKRLLSRYGCYLIISLIKAKEIGEMVRGNLYIYI
jgi:hypothetical protein